MGHCEREFYVCEWVTHPTSSTWALEPAQTSEGTVTPADGTMGAEHLEDNA